MREHTRRTFLASVGAASAVALAGCSSGSGDNSGGGGGGDTTTTASDDSGDSGGGSGFTETDTIEMNDELAFAPKQVQVEAGTTVTWENVGAVAHSVTAYEDEIPEGAAYFASGGFDSESAASDAYPDEGNIEEGGTYEHTFETTGTYEYYCIPHEMSGMVGTIKVV